MQMALKQALLSSRFLSLAAFNKVMIIIKPFDIDDDDDYENKDNEEDVTDNDDDYSDDNVNDCYGYNFAFLVSSSNRNLGAGCTH